ncbi:MAG: HAD family hydrolase, partial [Ignavibacteriaceae bacterium]
EIVRHFRVEKYFLYLFGLDNIYAASKIDLGKKLMKKLQVDFKNILLIGDTIHDFDVAKEIGADCMLISNGHQSKDRLLTCGVPVLDSLKDLVKKWD